MRGGGLSICLALLRIATGVSLIGPGLKKLPWFAHPGLEQNLANFASHAPNGMVTSYLHAVTPHHAVLARIVVLGELGLGTLLRCGPWVPSGRPVAADDQVKTRILRQYSHLLMPPARFSRSSSRADSFWWQPWHTPSSSAAAPTPRFCRRRSS